MKSRTGIIIAAVVIIAVAAGAGFALRANKINSTASEAVTSMSMHDGSMMTTLKVQTGDGYDQMFITMMSEHHAGAVAMATYVLRDAKHPEIRTLAANIISTQTKELADMKSWATKWGYSYAAPSQMVTNENTASFKGKTGDALDRQFLSDMLAHHQGALDMATLSATRANHVEIKTLSDSIISTQTNEIALMKGYASSFGYGVEGTDSESMHGMHS